MLSTIHSAKGQEWDRVHVLHVTDGTFPSEFSTGKADLIEEERRLLYVAMTRARHALDLIAPLKYYVGQQARYGDAHVYGTRSRFLTGRGDGDVRRAHLAARRRFGDGDEPRRATFHASMLQCGFETTGLEDRRREPAALHSLSAKLQAPATCFGPPNMELGRQVPHLLTRKISHALSTYSRREPGFAGSNRRVRQASVEAPVLSCTGTQFAFVARLRVRTRKHACATRLGTRRNPAFGVTANMLRPKTKNTGASPVRGCRARAPCLDARLPTT